MRFQVCLDAKKEALEAMQLALFRHLSEHTTFFCPLITKLLVKNIRECLQEFKEAGTNTIFVEDTSGQTLALEINSLLAKSRVISRFLTRSKRAETFQRLLLLLSPSQKQSLRRLSISFCEGEVAWKTSPKVPIGEAQLARIYRRSGQEADVGDNNQLALTGTIHSKIQRDRENLLASVKREDRS